MRCNCSARILRSNFFIYARVTTWTVTSGRLTLILLMDTFLRWVRSREECRGLIDLASERTNGRLSLKDPIRALDSALCVAEALRYVRQEGWSSLGSSVGVQSREIEKFSAVK